MTDLAPAAGAALLPQGTEVELLIPADVFDEAGDWISVAARGTHALYVEPAGTGRGLHRLTIAAEFGWHTVVHEEFFRAVEATEAR